MGRDTEWEARLIRARKQISVADKLRITLLGIAAAILALIYFGNKFYGDSAWYMASEDKMYIAATFLVLLMVASTFGKLFLVIRYNRMVKNRR